MVQYIIRRLFMIIPVLLGVSLLTFAIEKVTPGDPVLAMLGSSATPQRIAELRQQLGLNDPLLVQYFHYVWNAAHGNLGLSIRGQTPVSQEILARLPSTLQLTVFGMLLAILGGVPAGVIAATAKRRWVDSFTMVITLMGLSIPEFVLAIGLILVFGVHLRWVSVTGGSGFSNLILPGVCLAIAPGAVLARLTRSSILEVLGQDYVRTARAKGLAERLVITRHVMRNALNSVVTTIGIQFAGLMGGVVFIESVFARPGLGRFAVNAISTRDYPQVQGVVLFMAIFYVLINLAIDMLYSFMDPRIRYD